MIKTQDTIQILVVNLGRAIRETIDSAFHTRIYIREVQTWREAKEILERKHFDCLLADDLHLDNDGIVLLEEIKKMCGFCEIKNGEAGSDFPRVIMLVGKETAMEITDASGIDFIWKRDLTPALLKQSIQNAALFYAAEDVWRRQIRQLQVANIQLKEANEILERLACVDPLTEVLNRRGFQDVLSRESQYAQREGHSFTVLLIDLDNFKKINDTVGYDAGDFVLKEVINRLRGKLRSTDYVARIGGDEFMILLPNTWQTEGMDVAQKIRLAISEPIIWRTGTISITASIGLAVVKELVRSINELLAKTRIALVMSKESGKNQVTFGTSEEERRWQKKQSFAKGLDLLRQGAELIIAWQPIFRLESSKIIGYEFFTRSPVLGFEMPDDFFHLASEANMLPFLDRLCFEKCINATRSFDPLLQYHINLFPATLLALPVEEFIKDFPEDRPKRNYYIELSEKWFVVNTVELIKSIQRVRNEGILVVVDDVGFGYTFLESLVQLNPDRIKLDANCTRGVATDDAKCRSLESLLKIIRTLGCEIMVKGIEREADIPRLKEFGIEYGQGHAMKPA